MQALFSVFTVALYVADGYIVGETYHATSMELEVRPRAVPVTVKSPHQVYIRTE